MSRRGKQIFFFSIIVIVSLLFYFLGRKHAAKPETEISAQKTETEGGILVEKVIIEQDDKELQRVALTFDDGPHPYYTEQLLDGLKERGVHVTFFVTGEHAELHPDIIERMHEEGD